MDDSNLNSSILVVDDEDAIRETVADILESEGYRVVTAQNGAVAIRTIEQLREREPSLPLLMLLDMRMPVLDGWGVARELHQRGFRVPIIVMTAARDARRWADEIGADAYLAKPFEMDDLLNAVARIAGQSTAT